MARPKKPRFFDGKELPANLYPDPRKRHGYWKYVRADQTVKIFEASIDDAITAAQEANNDRDNVEPVKAATIKPQKGSLLWHVDKFIESREQKDTKLSSRKSWKNRQGQLRRFANDIPVTLPQHLTIAILMDWWDSMEFHAQHNRVTEMRRLINYLMLRELCPGIAFNPFNKNDEAPKFEKKSRPPKRRIRLTLEAYWAIYDRAGEKGYEFLQIAMAIGLATTLRRDDICNIRFDEHITRTVLKKEINKSVMQRGEANGSYLSWNLNEYPALREIINRGRELSMSNNRCPYLISYKYKQRRKSDHKEHHAQILPDFLTKKFIEVRDELGLFIGLPEGQTPPSFHEVRALSSRLFGDKYEVGDVKTLMAHTDEKITREIYQSGHRIEWTDISLTLDDTSFGRSF